MNGAVFIISISREHTETFTFIIPRILFGQTLYTNDYSI